MLQIVETELDKLKGKVTPFPSSTPWQFLSPLAPPSPGP